ncbi:MAG: alpha/beta hydrolase [Chloroflexota bacterium]
MTAVYAPNLVERRTIESDYWRTYHTAEDLARFEAIYRTYSIMSTGVSIHIDAYEQDDPQSPVFIFNHGGGGYSRLFIPIALALYDKGYTVLLPDQRGQGFSGGNRSDFTMGQFVENIVDVAKWAQEHYAGELFMGGGSLGGALTYKAAVAGAPVKAIVCHNLYDFGNPHDTLAVSIFALIAKYTPIAYLFSLVTRGIGALLPTIRLPYKMLARFDQMVDERNADFYPKYQHDPIPIKQISLRYMASTFSTPPARSFEANTLPVLVINQIRDKMVDPVVTHQNYDRLRGEKQYVEIDYGHWAMDEDFVTEWTDIVDDYLQSHLT